LTFEEFKILHKKFSSSSSLKSTLDADEQEKYIEAFYDNEQFSNWAIEQEMKEKSFDYSSFCCVIMAKHVSDSLDEDGTIKHEDADVIMNKWKDGSFGIPIHDGGPSIVKINFCPWCGENLETDE